MRDAVACLRPARRATRSLVGAAGLGLAVLAPVPAQEVGTFGDLRLAGLARDVDWPHRAAGHAYTVVCGIAADTTLAIRAAPAATAAVSARVARFTTVEVDTRKRRDGWVRVVGGDLSYDRAGRRRAYTSLLIEGWALEANLCAFAE